MVTHTSAVNLISSLRTYYVLNNTSEEKGGFIMLSLLFRGARMAGIYRSISLCLLPPFFLSLFHSRPTTWASPRETMGEKIDLQGQLQHASSKPVFLTVHDMGSNREFKNFALYFHLSSVQICSERRFSTASFYPFSSPGTKGI